MNAKPELYLHSIAKNWTEAEARVQMLKLAGIEARLKQDYNSEALSVARGRAALPYERWGIYMKREDFGKADDLLKDVLAQSELPIKKQPEKPAKKLARIYVALYLAIFGAALIWAVFEAVIFIIRQSY